MAQVNNQLNINTKGKTMEAKLILHKVEDVEWLKGSIDKYFELMKHIEDESTTPEEFIIHVLQKMSDEGILSVPLMHDVFDRADKAFNDFIKETKEWN